MIPNHETTARATPATKLARQEVQAKLLPLSVAEAAGITGVASRTVLRDRRELELKSLANLSESTEEYWALEMADIMGDVQFLRKKAKEQGKDGLLLATLDRWLKLVEMNVVKRTITATVDLNEQQSRYARIMRACRGIFADERWNEIIAYLESLPRDDNPFPTVGRIIDQKVLENE
jgi:hypothetical protein